VINTQHVGDVTIVQVAHGRVNALDVELLDAVTDRFGSLEKSEGRMADAAANDAEVERIWASQVTAQAIRDQLEKTVGRRT
jgi:hypothetical protein